MGPVLPAGCAIETTESIEVERSRSAPRVLVPQRLLGAGLSVPGSLVPGSLLSSRDFDMLSFDPFLVRGF